MYKVNIESGNAENVRTIEVFNQLDNAKAFAKAYAKNVSADYDITVRDASDPFEPCIATYSNF